MNQDVLTGIVIDERVELTTRDLCRACATSTEWVVELVHEGIVEVRGETLEEWRFSGAALARVIRARRLQRDLDLNLPGVALVLELMDEIEALRQQLRRL
ncbi:MAG TPA: chaperone modulator CbpM [Woeseiaceae bacterium]|jgi:chaperone modulatory protein CbpM|nr:chaperone modulator CbpM [Woeseiaceae bacterium]